MLVSNFAKISDLSMGLLSFGPDNIGLLTSNCDYNLERKVVGLVQDTLPYNREHFCQIQPVFVFAFQNSKKKF